jgi:hypothetical protein
VGSLPHAAGHERLRPHILVVERGANGSKTWPEPVLRDYAKALRIKDQNAFLMDGCGVIGRTRAGVAFAKNAVRVAVGSKNSG